ncbi:response regulator [Deinococcus sedimenti]|uniref:Response regulatory domain-containing protein n=1 Tax=Deinococcus sedimenti TaxID=1867090 RepID=A0ABQ2S4M8_9DEIO|nr:response regulator [Deinococcus sedimenti]GGR88454.1 hypothetical protein GCM10008960_14350 [Deinococcus sedimenti]
MTASAARRPTILIVDDSPAVLQNLEYLLAPHVNVVLAESGAAALQAVSADTALVLSDVRMPGMSGVELARTLRREHPQLPVVFMTGMIEADLRAEAAALGVLDILRKPLRPGVLFPALQKWLGRRDAPRPAPSSPVTSAAPPLPGGRGLPQSGTVISAPPVSRGNTPDRVWQQAQMFAAGLSVLPGVTAAGVFDTQGDPLTPTDLLGAQVGTYVRFLLTSAQTLAPHLQVGGALRAAQLEFQDRVLVVCPFEGGVVAVLVRDTPGASSVKAWMRSRLR